MKNLKKFIIGFILSIVSFPLFSFAQTRVCNPNIAQIGDILCKVGSLLKLVIPIIMALGIVYFVWGVVQYVIASDEEAKKSGKDRIIYGIIGLVVITSMWGLVAIVVDTFGIDPQGAGIVTNFVQDSSAIVQSTLGTCSLGSDPNLGKLLNYATCFINSSVIPLIVSLAMAMFVWGVVQYVINSDEEAKKEKGKQFMIWGIIGLTVMVGVWGLVKIVGTTFKIEYAIPQLK